jgi:two-component system chemotaxis response regulator CheB
MGQMKKRISVLVVDDSAFNRQTIKAVLEKDPDLEVAGVASDGMDAMSKVLRLRPDLITLDFEMPEMDGLSFLRWLMRESPTPVLMVSSHSDSATVFKALELGAVDFVVKPTSRASMELKNIERDLLEKIGCVKEMNLDVLSKNVRLLEARTVEKERKSKKVSDIDVLAIGSSTGGPSGLQMILSELPGDLPCATVISQHMPKGFTASFAERLNSICSLEIREARQGEKVEDETVYLCPGGYHMSFSRLGNEVRVDLEEAGPEAKYVPSVDIMMSSAVSAFPRKVMGIVITGMGNDGVKGMKEIRKSGGHTVAESEDTAVVFGMPAEVIKAKAAESVLPLDMISAEIRRVIIGERRL